MFDRAYFNVDKFLSSLPFFYILLMFPYSVVHQSSMFGYFLYFNLFLRIQMTLDKMMKFRLCDSCLGFSITAFFICLFFIIMKLCGVDDKYLEPFASSVETLNRNILYFGVLSDVALCGYRNTNILGHLIYITILGTGFYYEINYQTKGFRYNSVIYMVLYVFIMSNHMYWNVSKSCTGSTHQKSHYQFKNHASTGNDLPRILAPFRTFDPAYPTIRRSRSRS